MIMKYNSWFDEYYRYLKGTRNGEMSYNDTRFVDAFERYSKLTELMNSQPYGIVGNQKGFDKLIDLLTKSNYTFEDVNEALIKTYKENMRNAMGKNLVDTHSSIFRCKSTDIKYVSSDTNISYKIIDVPWDQLHFGDRDEFIRQHLRMMWHSDTDYYVHMRDLLSTEINSLLGFTIMITANGRISNDWYVGFNDHGLQFKVGWRNSEDAEFIIYMLDECVSYKIELPMSYVNYGVIPKSYSLEAVKEFSTLKGANCIIDIYDASFTASMLSLPTFGTVDTSLKIKMSVQDKTVEELESIKTSTVTMVIYIFKYLHEADGIYPAINYFDLVESRKVYSNGDFVKNIDGNHVVAGGDVDNACDICTPPICLDRPVDTSFTTIVECLNIKENMMSLESMFIDAGNVIRMSPTPSRISELQKTLNVKYNALNRYYLSYMNCALLTSLIPNNLVNKFKDFLDRYMTFVNSTFAQVQVTTLPEFYERNYELFVNSLCKPFENDVLSPLMILPDVQTKFFYEPDDTYKRFNRPVSEDSFISLKYDRSDGAWKFACPIIRHFNGIGNTFYISDDLTGNEIFKFFVLYSDSFNASSDTKIESFDEDTIFDFDKFCVEAEKHLGYLKYWHVENKLMRLSQILFSKYDEATIIQVISKILKKKVECPDLLDNYSSDMLYDFAGITTSTENYSTTSDNTPLVINYLFYTLQLMRDNDDRMQMYFFRHLLNDEFINSYSDIDVHEGINNTNSCPINYSKIHLSPNTFDASHSTYASNVNHLYYGLPMIVKNGANVSSSDTYRYVFNEYPSSFKFINSDESNQQYYASFASPGVNGYVVHDFSNDIKVARLMCLYLTYVYNCINTIATNYQRTVFDYETIKHHIEMIRTITTKIGRMSGKQFENSDTQARINLVMQNNVVINAIQNIHDQMKAMTTFRYQSNYNMSTMEFINKNLLSTIRDVYMNNGFENKIKPYVKELYTHIRKINTRMNIHQIEEWGNGINLTVLKKLDSFLTPNDDYKVSNGVFYDLAIKTQYMLGSLYDPIDEIKASIDLLIGYYQTSHMDVISRYVSAIYNENIFDMYVIDEIDFTSKQLSTKPAYCTCVCTKDSHFQLPSQSESGNLTLIFKPEYEITSSNKYDITHITKICEYIIFQDTSLNVTFTFYSQSGDSLGTTTGTISFTKISNTADVSTTFNQISNIDYSMITMENTHETYEINSNRKIVNSSFANMNYELLIGNRFMPLNHETEIILHNETMLPNANDCIHIPNYVINRFANDRYGHGGISQMYFKAARVLHQTTSVNGKHFVGQRIYLESTDGRMIFPCIVNAIDHNISHGFIEAEVDSLHAPWVNIKDPIVCNNYLLNDIKCKVVDDNISNWLDEFHNSKYPEYPIIEEDTSDVVYERIGNPVYVTRYGSMTYTRIAKKFNIPYKDEDMKLYNMKYLGHIRSMAEPIIVGMIDKSFCDLDISQLHPVLRDEPNDHTIWDEEKEKFANEAAKYRNKMIEINVQRAEYREMIAETTNLFLLNILQLRLSDLDYKYEREHAMCIKLADMCDQLEDPTTWYNVKTYESAIVYIENGRADNIKPYRLDIRDVSFSDELQILLFDVQTNEWINPGEYYVTRNFYSSVPLDVTDEYKTNNVLGDIKITFRDAAVDRDVLIYLGYKRGNAFDSLTKNENSCYVRFKPALSIAEITTDGYYDDVTIRRHNNTHEKYIFDGVELVDDFTYPCLPFKRVEQNGRYNSPQVRMCDLTVSNNSTVYSNDKFEVWVKNPFKDTKLKADKSTHSYNAIVKQPISYFNQSDGDVHVNLISVNKNHFNGNISDVMFDATITIHNNAQVVRINDSSLNITETGTYTCMVLMSDNYRPFGGLINVTVANTSERVMNTSMQWIKLTYDPYRMMPDECLIVPKFTVVDSKPIYVILHTEYGKDVNDTITKKGDNVNNPFEYYYDTKHCVRYPLADIRCNDISQRLVINNSNVKIIKSNCIGITRYVLQKIPSDGVIDLTGYIPSPLTRERYEFWVNGEDKTRSDDLIILSPTSIQFINLKSLRNFELVELVYDVNDNILTQKGCVYFDEFGNTSSSYKISAKKGFENQSFKYIFNVNSHSPNDDVTRSIITNPNNNDVQTDILNYIQTNTVNSYNELHNIPSINGVPLYHPSITSLGFIEIDNDYIISLFDNVWKKEMSSRRDMCVTHKNGLSLDKPEVFSKLHVMVNPNSTSNDDYYLAYVSGLANTRFTVYVTDNKDTQIYDVEHTLCIVPFIKNGVMVVLPASYKNKWIHTTIETIKPIQLR